TGTLTADLARFLSNFLLHLSKCRYQQDQHPGFIIFRVHPHTLSLPSSRDQMYEYFCPE
ncbi:hypothetical protein O181_101696, partial [Austropuccinia psidii MF-1]|nr:hypothetical protein [Austropuccinia psidii MF-1]